MAFRYENNGAMVDLSPFFIEVYYLGKPLTVEIKPCCRENEIMYYDVFLKNSFEFTITPDISEDNIWRVSLMNADKELDPELVRLIGEKLDLHFFNIQ
jgi:hypothetical protein